MSLTRASQVDKVIFDLSNIETHTYQSNGRYGSKYLNVVYVNQNKLQKVIIKHGIATVQLSDIESAIAEIRLKQTPDNRLHRIERIVNQYGDIDFSDDDDDCGMYDRCGGNADDAFYFGRRDLATRIKKVLYPEKYQDDQT